MGPAWSAVACSSAALAQYARSQPDAGQAVYVYAIDLESLGCEGDRREAARGALRQVLGAHLGVTEEAAPLEHDENGRPQIAGTFGATALKVSSSRSGRLAVFALCTGHEVGIDIESVDATRFGDDVAQTMLSRPELAIYAKLEDGLRARWLAEAWAAKEAILKGMGLGLAVPPALVEPGLTMFASTLAPVRWRTATVPGSWSVTSMPWNGHVIALAQRGPGLPLRCAQLLCREAISC